MTAFLNSQKIKWMLLTAVLTIAAGCFTQLSSTRNVVPPELEQLYAKIHEYRRDYERGLELIVSGDAVMGRNMLAAATDRISSAAEECAWTAGCDIGLFTEAMSHVLNEQRRAAQTQAEGLEAPQTRKAEAANPGESPSVEAAPEMRRTVSLLRGTDLRELITFDGPVNAALNDWLTWNRPDFIDGYENYQFLRHKVAPIYEEAGLPEALLFAMMVKETGVKVHAYSRAGAAGPLQFMRHTGRRYGLRNVDGFDMRLDPAAATRANVAYLNDQFDAFDNNLEKALAAYNVGEGRVRRLHRRLEGADFWEPRMYYSLPSETRDYVPQILAAAWLFLRREDYDLEFPQFETSITTIVLKEDISIGELTICLGQQHNPNGWFRTLRNLNPRLTPNKRAKSGQKLEMPSMLVPIYARQCVGDSKLLALARELHDAGYPDKPEMIRYIVRRGDTLAAIAARHGCSSVGKLADINGIRAPDYVIHVGQRLSVPGCT